jgi:hypothetical protein
VQIDAAPFLLGPGASATMTSDLVEIEDNQSAVFAAQYFQDLGQVGPFNNSHTPGPELGNVMTATITSPGGSCDYYAPTILAQPQSVTADEGRGVNLLVNADGNDLTLSYQWMKEGVDLADGGNFSGVTTDELSIDALDAASEGFYSVRVYNSCGSTVSQSALVFITGHNNPPPRTNACPADFNASGAITVQDIFDFLETYFSGDAAADFNASGDTTVQDIFDFLAAYFTGCP